MFFVRGCPFLGGSFIGGSTVRCFNDGKLTCFPEKPSSRDGGVKTGMLLSLAGCQNVLMKSAACACLQWFHVIYCEVITNKKNVKLLLL